MSCLGPSGSAARVPSDGLIFYVLRRTICLDSALWACEIVTLRGIERGGSEIFQSMFSSLYHPRLLGISRTFLNHRTCPVFRSLFPGIWDSASLLLTQIIPHGRSRVFHRFFASKSPSLRAKPGDRAINQFIPCLYGKSRLNLIGHSTV
jgi:hypothetical protein